VVKGFLLIWLSLGWMSAGIGAESGLELVREVKLATLSGFAGAFEASGVCVADGAVYVAFDNRVALLRTGPELLLSSMKWEQREGDGFEGLACADGAKQVLAMVEEAKHQGKQQGRVYRFGLKGDQLSKAWLPYALHDNNKGFEGIELLDNDAGDRLLLALCEGNRCRGGKKGRKPGHGRIKVFQQHADTWRLQDTIKLDLPFTDYSGMAVKDGRIAIVSQTSSMLWVGPFHPADRSIHARQGRLFSFPRDDQGRTIYCNIEGVAWLTDDLLVLVSDRYKRKKQPSYCADKDQSVHVFRLHL